MSRSNYLQPFPNEFGPTAPNKRSSKDGVVNFDSVSIADSKASSLDTERLTVIRADNTLTRDEGQLYLAPDSRLSNRSMSPATPSPPASPNVKQRKRKTPPPSALSKADSIRSQSPGEDTAESTDHSSSVVPSFDVPHLSQPGTSSPPPVATATKSMLSEMLSSPAPAIKEEMPVSSPEKIEYIRDTPIQVICKCKDSQPLTTTRNNELYVAVKDPLVDTVKIYNLIDCQMVAGIDVSKKTVVSHADCKILHCKKFSLLSGQLNTATKTWRLRLYQTQADTVKTQTSSWDQVTHFKFSVLQLDYKNSIAIPQKDDGIILVSVVQESKTSSYVLIYSFPLAKASNLKAACFSLPLPRNRTTKYEIQSCLLRSNSLYCSIFLPEKGTMIYMFGLASLQCPIDMQKIVNCQHEGFWQIEDQICYLAELINNEVSIISFTITNSKTVMEIKQILLPPAVSPPEYKYEFMRVVKIIEAFLVPGDRNPLITVLYHDNVIGKCLLKRFKVHV